MCIYSIKGGINLIEVKNLTKKYGNHVAIDDLSFSVERGMIYGFLGKNGAGKSTTMNIMTGYIAPTSGSVKINGYDISKNPIQAKKSIGYLPEIPPVYQDMTVYEYLKFATELKKIKKKDRKEEILKAMESVQISDVRNRLIRNLSKGYKQRVGLAQAILGNPEVIILDEPTVGLDPKQIIEIRKLIKKLSQKHTVILSSHILSEVSAVCDYVMIISRGKLVASDTPDKLVTLLKGGKQLEISIIGDKDKLENVVKEMDGVDEYSFDSVAINENEETEIKGYIKFSRDNDIRKELFYRLAASNLPIMSLKMYEKTLEDVFLELTGEDKLIDDVASGEIKEEDKDKMMEDDINSELKNDSVIDLMETEESNDSDN